MSGRLEGKRVILSGGSTVSALPSNRDSLTKESQLCALLVP
jgi:hypothetical protein